METDYQRMLDLFDDMQISCEKSTYEGKKYLMFFVGNLKIEFSFNGWGDFIAVNVFDA